MCARRVQSSLPRPAPLSQRPCAADRGGGHVPLHRAAPTACRVAGLRTITTATDSRYVIPLNVATLLLIITTSPPSYWSDTPSCLSISARSTEYEWVGSLYRKKNTECECISYRTNEHSARNSTPSALCSPLPIPLIIDQQGAPTCHEKDFTWR